MRVSSVPSFREFVYDALFASHPLRSSAGGACSGQVGREHCCGSMCDQARSMQTMGDSNESERTVCGCEIVARTRITTFVGGRYK